jgi:hypothetical protein
MAYVGPLGSGKTYTAVTEAHKVLKVGGTVACNFVLRKLRESDPGNIVHFSSLDELLEIEDSYVIADEAHMLMPSWDPKALHLSHRFWITHCRKVGNEVALVVQDEDRVARTMRDLIHFTAHMRRWLVPFMGRVFTRTVVPYGRPRKEGWKEHVRFKMAVARTYDTNEILAPSFGDERERALCEEISRRRAAGVPLKGLVAAVDERLARELAIRAALTDGGVEVRRVRTR